MIKDQVIIEIFFYNDYLPKISICKKDTIYYGDQEYNLWNVNNNKISYSYKLDSKPLQSIVVGNTIIIR